MKLRSVLGLFDGMSCGQIALQRAGIEYQKYYSSEIDEPAMQIAQKNYPETIQVGDITKLSAKDLPEDIDLMIGGSPCQGFSMIGKKLNFDDEVLSRSYLPVLVMTISVPILWN